MSAREKNEKKKKKKRRKGEIGVVGETEFQVKLSFSSPKS
jgi:hypothetical protein